MADGRAGGGQGGASAGAGRLRFTLIAIIVLLYVVSIPWYRDDEAPLRLILGLPDWVAIAVACYVAVAALNSLAWLVTDIADDPGEQGGDLERPSPRDGSS